MVIFFISVGGGAGVDHPGVIFSSCSSPCWLVFCCSVQYRMLLLSVEFYEGCTNSTIANAGSCTSKVSV